MNRMHRSIQIRDIGNDGRTFTAMAVRYNVVDSYDTVFLPGCFTRSLQEHLPRITWAHSWSEVVGRVTSYEDTPEGLIVHARLSDPESVPRAKQAIAQLRDGDVEDVSVGFSPMSSTMIDGRTAFEDCDLDEIAVGLVRGAVPGAKVLALRSIENVQSRSVKMISEEDAARIINATIEKMQGGAVGTDVLLAGLQDIKALAVESEADGEDEETQTEGEGGTEEGTETQTEEQTAETTEGETESTEGQQEAAIEETTVVAETGTEQEAAETEIIVDEEIQSLLAEVDELLVDREESWIPDVAITASVGDGSDG